MPGTALYVAARIDTDDRVREALTPGDRGGLPLLETPRVSSTGSPTGPSTRASPSQVPPYDYAHPERPARPRSRARHAR